MPKLAHVKFALGTLVAYCSTAAVVQICVVDVSATEPPPQKSFEDISDAWVGDLGDAIDPYTGDLAYSVTEVSLPARGGLSLSFTRTYNSGFYAPKFADSYDCRIDSSGVRSLFMGVGWLMPVAKIVGDTISWPGGGSESMFHDNSAWGKSHGRLKTKSFAIYTNHYDSTDPNDELWTDTLLFLDGSKWFFSKKWTSGTDSLFHGKYLRRMVDSYGNYIDYVYFKTSPMLKEIRESTGRKIWFTYNNMADTLGPTDTTMLTLVSWLNHAGNAISVQYSYTKMCNRYTGTDCKKYLTEVVYPTGDTVKYTYTDTLMAWGNTAYACSQFDTIMPDFRLLSTARFTGGSKVEYQYGEGLRQYCSDNGYANSRINVHRRIRNDLDTVEFRHLSPTPVDPLEGQEIYIRSNTSGELVVYKYLMYVCNDLPYACNTDFTSAGIRWIKRFDLRAQTCGDSTTPIWERHFKWCDTKIGYDSLVSPFTPVWIPLPKKVVTIQCGDTVSVVETSVDTCTGEALGSYSRFSQNSGDESAHDTVLSRSFDDEKWTSMAIDRRVIERTLHGVDTSLAHAYWDVNKVRVKGRRVGIGADTILVERFDRDAYGNVIKVTDANGNARETVFDATATFPVSSKNDQNGNSYLLATYSTYTGALLKVKDSVEAESTLYIYDASDRPIRTRRPLDTDSSTVRRYYPSARILRDSIKIRYGVYATSESESDVSGRSSQTKAIGASMTILSRAFSDPANREVRSVRPRYSTDTDSAVTKVYSDALGRRRKTILPNGDEDSVRYAYRSATQYDPLGQAVAKSLADGFGRSRKSWADASFTDSVMYRNGPFGRLQSIVNPMLDSTYTRFDAFNRPDTSREVDHDSVKAVYYDRVGNPRIVKNPLGKWVYYKYDKLNRPTEFGIATTSFIPDSSVSQVYPTSGHTALVRYQYDGYFGHGGSDSSTSGYAKPHGYLTRRWEKGQSQS